MTAPRFTAAIRLDGAVCSTDAGAVVAVAYALQDLAEQILTRGALPRANSSGWTVTDMVGNHCGTARVSAPRHDDGEDAR